MNYDARIAVIEDALLRFQSRYTSPRAMGRDAQADTFAGTCEAINRNFPAGVNEGQMRDRLRRVFDFVADRHETNAWPLQAEYVRALRETSASGIVSADGGWKVGPEKIFAGRIRRGEPVGDMWLFGRNFRALKDRHDITEADVQPYRNSLFFADRDQVGEEEAKRRQAERMAW